MKLNALSLVKRVVTGAVGIGTMKIVSNVIKAYVNPENIVDKVTTAAGAWAIGGVVASATREYTDEAIDEVAEAIGTIVTAVKTGISLGEINKKKPTADQLEAAFKSVGLKLEDFELGKNGRWSKREKTPMMVLTEKLDRINKGESTFAKEELDRDFFVQDQTTGHWRAMKY